MQVFLIDLDPNADSANKRVVVNKLALRRRAYKPLTDRNELFCKRGAAVDKVQPYFLTRKTRQAIRLAATWWSVLDFIYKTQLFNGLRIIHKQYLYLLFL